MKTGQIVYVNDSELILAPLDVNSALDGEGGSRPPELELRFYLDYVDPLLRLHPAMNEVITESIVTASTALFGADPTAPQSIPGQAKLRFGHGEGVRVTQEHSNPYGCRPYTQSFENDAILVRRGECTFLEKLVLAQAAGASGVVVVSDEETQINPSADVSELSTVDDLIGDVVIVVLRRSAGEVVSSMLNLANKDGIGQVMVTIEPGRQSATGDRGEERNNSRDINRVLYLNGHPLLNTRLLV